MQRRLKSFSSARRGSLATLTDGFPVISASCRVSLIRSSPCQLEIAPNYTSARYVGAPLGASRGGQYWVNTYALDKRPLYEMTALTPYEAVPGHSGARSRSKTRPSSARISIRTPSAKGGALLGKLGKEMGVSLRDAL
ncbi:MAG: DUF885 family protein [Parvularculaceae bacterium]